MNKCKNQGKKVSGMMRYIPYVKVLLVKLG